jgi:excisionase family DNA binding protein
MTTLKQDIAKTLAMGVEPLLSLKQVAELTGCNIRTLERWAYKDKNLPVVHWGVSRRVRVKYSTVKQFFPTETRAIDRIVV